MTKKKNNEKKQSLSSSSSSSISSSSSSMGAAVEEQSQIANSKSKIKYAFPTVSACPRCRGTNTFARSTQGRIQYRQCRSAVCRRSYTVIGAKVK